MKRRLLALVLVVSLVASMCTTAFAAQEDVGEINYVSIGDSMANGYCFDGYEQGNGDKIDFFAGKGVYGDDAYPNQFADWLAEETDKTVNHTKLAVSALRAEDLYFLLGGREEPQDGWENQVNGYTEVRDDEALAAFYQEAVTNADIITLGVGNASFGAYMLHRVTDALGVFGASLDENEKVDLEDALVDLDEEQTEIILEAYNQLKAEMAKYVPADLAEQYNVDEVCGILAYTAAGFILNYAGSVEQIVKLNPDAEIILVGLMNTTYGMTITGEGFDPIPVGDIMDEFFGALNAYMAGLPAVKQLAGEWTEAKFYYADQPAPKFISQVFADLKDAGWGKIQDGRLSGDIVRERNITAYNDTLREMIAMAFGAIFHFDMNLPKISLDEVKAYEENPPVWTLKDSGYGFVPNGAGPIDTHADEKNLSIAIYLGIEDAVAESCDTLEIPLSGLMKIAGDLSSVFSGMDIKADDPNSTPETVREGLGTYLTSTEEFKGMCKIYALFKVGNGMSVHPTPEGHDQIAASVIDAYEAQHTAADETKDNLIVVAEILADLVAEYYDEAYAYAYAEAKAAGYIDTAAAGIDAAIAALKGIDVSATEMTDEFKAELAGEIEEVIETLAAAKALINEADVLDQASLDALIAMLDEGGEAIENIKNLLKQAGFDMNDLVVVPALEQAKSELTNVVIPAMKAAAKEIAAKAYEKLVALAEQAGEDLAEAYDAFVEAFLEFLPEADAWLYDWFYNNPDKVIAFFEEYGDEMGQLIVDNHEAILAVLGFIAAEFGDDALEYVLNNPEETLEQFVAWYEKYGERTWAMILVYLEKLGVLECLPTEEDVKAAIEAIEKQIEDCYKQLETVTGEAVEELEAAIEELKAAAEKLNAMVEGYAQLVDATVRAQLEAAVKELEKAVAELEKAVQELNAAAEAQIAKAEAAVKEALAKVEKAIAKVEAAVNGVIADVNETIKDVYAALEKAKEELGAGAAQIVENLKDALADLYDVIVENAEKIDAAVLAEIFAAVEDIEDALNKLDAIIKGAADAAIEDVTAELKSALAELQDAVEALIEATEGNVDQIIKEATAAFEQAYLDATTDEYTITKDSYYVAIGDETVLAEPSYADMLAETLEIDYTKIGEEGLTVAGTEAVLMENIAEIVKADLITLGYSNNTMISFMIDQATSLRPEELDWSVYGYDELGEYVDTALAEITEELYAQGLDAQTAGLMVTAIESYAYAYTGYMVGYPMVVEAIHEINPDALVIMVGMNNALTDVTLEAEGVELELGEYVQYLVDAANIEALAYAMLTGNAIYVDAPDVETMLEAYDVELGTDMFTVLQLLAFPQNRALLNPSETGHDYIKEQILNALELDYEYLLGDVNLDGEVNSADTNLLFRFVMKRLPEGFTALQMWAGDVNEDGEVNSADTNLLFRYVMKYIPALGAQAQ